MKTRPPGVDDARLSDALNDGWGLTPTSIEHVPVGFGSYHWLVVDATGVRRFVTVDDLEGFSSGADGYDDLARAFATARTLHDSGLDFVVAPVPASDGAGLRRLDDRYSVAVFPCVDGPSGDFGDVLEPGARDELIDRLAALHGATDVVRATAPRSDREPIARSIASIGVALEQAGRPPWTGGPYAEPARRWLCDRDADVRGLVERVQRASAERVPVESLVVTHGEPHPGNVIATEAGLVLIDWDTVGLAPPERDLWLVGDDEHVVARYEGATGRVVNQDAMARFRDAWALADVASYLDELRAVHEADADTTHAWKTLEGLTWSRARPGPPGPAVRAGPGPG